MILLTKNNKEIKGRFEFDPHNAPSFYESVSKMNEVKGFVLHFNTPEADYMRKNGVMKKKMSPTFKQMMDTRTVKYDDLLKAFPQSTDIVLKDLPSIPKGNTGSVDYYTVDSDGDVVPLKQGDIGSGLD